MLTLDEVIEGCRNGDATMQKELYDRYSAQFYSICLRYAPDADVAKDMLIEGFLTIFSEIETFRGEGSFEGWMHAVMRSAIVAESRRNRKHRESVALDEADEVGSHTSSPESSIDLRSALQEAMQKLSEKERVAFNLVAVDGYTLDEAAKLIKEPLSTIKTRYYSAKEKMRLILLKKIGKDYLKK